MCNALRYFTDLASGLNPNNTVLVNAVATAIYIYNDHFFYHHSVHVSITSIASKMQQKCTRVSLSVENHSLKKQIDKNI